MGLSVASAGCLIAVVPTGGASTPFAATLFLASAVVTGLNVGITMYRQQTGFIDDQDATVSYLLGALSMVPILEVGASIGGAALEWRD